ncbi:MAG: class I SAM-dependent methyltransferase, partial [Bacteroidota bacterium]
KKNYGKSFYGDADNRKRNAYTVFSTVFEILKPKSLVDVGCGLGHWLHVAKEEFGIEKILGIDGNYVKKENFLIPWENFLRHNLEHDLEVNDRFEMCMSIETGEHLPPEKASLFAKTLTSLADVVLFSAAAPYQKGVHHLNENTPSYWAGKFAEQNFLCFDILRDMLWEIEGINCIYPQNLLLFVKEGKASFLEEKGFKPTPNPQLKYHPGFVHRRLTQEGKGPIKGLLRKLAY